MRRRPGFAHRTAAICLSLWLVMPTNVASPRSHRASVDSREGEGVRAHEREGVGRHSKVSDPIRTMSVTIVTSSDWFAGTDNDVWLDIGPTAWKLGGTFERGSTRTINIDVNRANDDALYIDDILQVRLEKKGLHGWTDAPDSPLDLVLPVDKLSPAAIVDVFEKQIPVAQYGVTRARAALDAANNLLDVQDKAITKANKVLDDASNEIKQLPNALAAVQQRIINTNFQLAREPLTILGDVPIPGICTKKVWGVPVPYPCIQRIKQTIANKAIDELQRTIGDFTKEQNRLEGRAVSVVVDKQNALRDIVVASGLRVEALARKEAATLSVESANEALVVAQEGLAEAKEMAAHLPGIPIDLPLPNQWKPEKVTLTVNGEVFRTYSIDHRFKHGQSSWVQLVQPASAEEQFVRRLRIDPNTSSTHATEYIAGASTVFKNLGISGWQSGPIERATVEGTLIHEPSPGSDGFVSLDLEVTKVSAGRTWVFFKRRFDLADASYMHHKHFIRIEYSHNDGRGSDDHRYENWKVGDRFQIAGLVRWDTDRLGFLELHPIGRGNVNALK